MAAVGSLEVRRPLLPLPLLLPQLQVGLVASAAMAVVGSLEVRRPLLPLPLLLPQLQAGLVAAAAAVGSVEVPLLLRTLEVEALEMEADLAMATMAAVEARTVVSTCSSSQL